MKLKVGAIILLALVLVAGNVVAETTHQFDIAMYKSTAESVIASLTEGDVNVISDLESLIAIGVEGCKEHMGEEETPEIEQALMQLVIDNADSLTSLTLDERCLKNV